MSNTRRCSCDAALDKNGLCPYDCERFRKPHQRALSLEYKLRKREKKSDVIGLGAKSLLTYMARSQ